ncbi:MAG: hypothetical protein KME64_43845 [Scytonematopsis contorta HA4267-MV1]|jgi:uncharacterized protein involved in exopolysaccharide biosynthesis|nr:hypothetical protein [Scytonematopsis contorta HA4267-MV1]
MSELSSISNWFSRSEKASKRRRIFLLLWLSANVTIWSIALAYLQLRKSTYTSQWTINVPASAPNTNVSVPNVGQASSWNSSPYTSFVDPRENYKFLLESNELLEIATHKLNIPVEQFTTPRIKVKNNTTFIELEIKGDSPKQAQAKALAIHQALEQRLNLLRQEEIAQQDHNLKVALKSDTEKLQLAKRRLYEYKKSSSLINIEQLRDSSVTLEGLRRQKLEALTRIKDTNAKIKELSANIGLSAGVVAEILKLQSDRVFQGHLANYSRVGAELSNLSAKFLPINPVVVTKQQEKNAAQAALLERGKLLLKKSISSLVLEQLVINGSGASESSTERTSLFKELITLQTQQQGLKEQIQELDKQIFQLELRLKILSQDESKLDNLERDVKIAEAIFSANYTKLNLSRSLVSDTYPQISMVVPPSFPKEANGPKAIFVLLGVSVCSILLTTGTITLSIRRNKIDKANITNK